MRGEMEMGEQGVKALMQRGLDRHPPLIREDCGGVSRLLESRVFLIKNELFF
jgi:hypothetical protein